MLVVGVVVHGVLEQGERRVEVVTGSGHRWASKSRVAASTWLSSSESSSWTRSRRSPREILLRTAFSPLPISCLRSASLCLIGRGRFHLRTRWLARPRGLRLARPVGAPHLFEIVELAHVRLEDVDDRVAGVEQDPIAIGHALDPRRRIARRPKSMASTGSAGATIITRTWIFGPRR